MISPKNNACNPANGTSSFNLFRNTIDMINEKMSEVENNTKKESVGKLIAINKKNSKSPNPNP